MFTAIRFVADRHRIFSCRVSVAVSKKKLTGHVKIILVVAVLHNAPTKRGSVGLISSSALLWDRASQTGSLSV
jgi:hypothetical protein